MQDSLEAQQVDRGASLTPQVADKAHRTIPKPSVWPFHELHFLKENLLRPELAFAEH